MNMEWQPGMKDVISEVLETMFFVSVDFRNWLEPVSDLSWTSEIDLLGEVQKAHLVLRVTESFARMLAANFLALDEGDVMVGDIEDVLKEAANILGGNYISHLGGQDWTLGLPTFNRLQRDDGLDPAVLPIMFMGERAAAVSLQVDSRHTGQPPVAGKICS